MSRAEYSLDMFEDDEVLDGVPGDAAAGGLTLDDVLGGDDDYEDFDASDDGVDYDDTVDVDDVLVDDDFEPLENAVHVVSPAVEFDGSAAVVAGDGEVDEVLEDVVEDTERVSGTAEHSVTATDGGTDYSAAVKRERERRNAVDEVRRSMSADLLSDDDDDDDWDDVAERSGVSVTDAVTVGEGVIGDGDGEGAVVEDDETNTDADTVPDAEPDKRGFSGFAVVDDEDSRRIGDGGADARYRREQMRARRETDAAEIAALGGYIEERTKRREQGGTRDKDRAHRLRRRAPHELEVDPVSVREVDASGDDGRVLSHRARVSEKFKKPSARTPENGRLSEREVAFFTNLALDPYSPTSFDRVRKLLRPPVSKEEAERSYKKRMELLNVALGDERSEKFGQRVKALQTKDFDVLEFLAQFKYGTESHIASLLGVSSSTARNRLTKLRQLGLVRQLDVYGTKPLMAVSRVGMLLSGFELRNTTDGNITFSTIPHQFTINHVAANVWSGALNVLNEEVYPVLNRKNRKTGELVFGDELVSETSIQSSFSTVRGIMKAADYRKKIISIEDGLFQEWENNGGAEVNPRSPEFEYGNEFMWAVLPPISAGIAHHVPDLVVRRERAKDGSPNSIAVEVELSDKGTDEAYQRTLEAYRTDGRFFKKVVWICRLKSTAKRLERIARDNGMWDSGKVEIWPVLTKHGVFRGGDMWRLGSED